MCLRLSLLNPSHHLRSTYTNRFFSLVMQIDFILNSCLWVHPSPISKFQTCYKLKNMPWLPSFSVVLLYDPLSSLLRSLGACQPFSWNLFMGSLLIIIMVLVNHLLQTLWKVAQIVSTPSTRRKTCIFDYSLRLNFSRKRHFATEIPLVA